MATPSIDPDEVWKPIPGYDGYEASTLGRIRSLDRLIWDRTHWRRWTGRILKLSRKKQSGHLIVSPGRSKHAHVHSLVMRAFIGPPPFGTEICHFDGDPSNNRLTNLRYDTPKGNGIDKIRHGTARRGETSNFAKLTKNDVVAIRQSLASDADLAKQYKMSPSNIWMIRKKQTWAWLDA